MRPSLALLVAAAASCGGTLDVGSDVLRGQLPVDERSPVILLNDSPRDNWQGEYAVLFASSGGPAIAGIVVTPSFYWPNIDSSMASWQALVAAARSSGMTGIPDPVASPCLPLSRPDDGIPESTTPNNSVGAHLIVDVSARLARPTRPVVVVTGAHLTDVADAYLLDHSVAERVVVVSALGSPAGMGAPNGEQDAWADWIVAQRFRYVQVSAYYDQTGDVPSSQLASLPANALGALMKAKQPDISSDPTAADQIAVLAMALPSFVVGVQRVSIDPAAVFDRAVGPALSPDPEGNCWLVTSSAGVLAGARLWQMLLAPETYVN